MKQYNEWDIDYDQEDNSGCFTILFIILSIIILFLLIKTN